jgi:predicted negative regulator of RcsB-dependent stress response
LFSFSSNLETGLHNGSFILDWTAWSYEQRHRSVSSQLQKELGLLIDLKDPLLALWVSQRELLEQNAAQQQKLLSEFQAALGKSQTAWSEQAKALAQQSLNAGLQAARDSRLKPLLKSEP